MRRTIGHPELKATPDILVGLSKCSSDPQDIVKRHASLTSLCCRDGASGPLLRRINLADSLL
jgi:hypothetical protein